jgi:hypothetical protein
MGILTEFLTNFDDGRSKSFFCISCALLPLEKLQESHDIVKNSKDSTDIKIKYKRLRKLLSKTADTLEIDLKLNTKK